MPARIFGNNELHYMGMCGMEVSYLKGRLGRDIVHEGRFCPVIAFYDDTDLEPEENPPAWVDIYTTYGSPRKIWSRMFETYKDAEEYIQSLEDNQNLGIITLRSQGFKQREGLEEVF